MLGRPSHSYKTACATRVQIQAMERRVFLWQLGAAVCAAPAMISGQQIVGEQAGDFDSDGVSIHYVVAGEGEPVILLHGFIFSIRPAWIAGGLFAALRDRKSTRLNSSHVEISYAVFCLKKKKKKKKTTKV